MDEMIEKVARAICESPDPLISFYQLPEDAKEEFRVMARSATRAMREHINGVKDGRFL